MEYEKSAYLERENQGKILKEKFDQIISANGLTKDGDGNMRFKDWQDALAFQDLAKEQGLEVCVVEPSVNDLKNKVFLGEYFRVYPKRIIND